MSIYSTLDLHSHAAADAALEAVIQVAEQDHREPDMDEAAIRLLEVIADYLLQCGRKKQPEFLPVGVCSCRHYHGQMH